MNVKYIKESTVAGRNHSVFNSILSITLPRYFINLPTVLFATFFFALQ